jgi:hypothetical protein
MPQAVSIPEEDKEGVTGRVHFGTFWSSVTREEMARISWLATEVNWLRKEDRARVLLS